MDKQYLEIKGEIRDWWERPDQDYDGIGAHGVNSSVEKEIWRSGLSDLQDAEWIGSRSGDHHYGADIGRNLPFSNGADPKKVSDMFREAGLSNIDWLLFGAPGEMHRDTILIYGEKLGAITWTERMSDSDPEFL